jgi:hypothetical protein
MAFRGFDSLTRLLLFAAGEKAMTEEEWLACTDPQPMLAFLRSKGSDRKFRLFAVVCCFGVWYLLRDRRSKKAVKASERYADGLTGLPRMTLMQRSAGQAVAEWVSAESVAVGRRFPEEVAHAVTLPDAVQAAARAADLAARLSEAEAREIGYNRRQQSQARLLRDIIGNPFRPVSVNPTWLTPTVTALATAAYEERALPSGELDPVRLAVLADALEDAGAAASLLEHLRGPGPHVRGCWVLDCLTGRQ